MKILHVIDSGGFYGKERIVLELLRGSSIQSNVINLSSNKTFEEYIIKSGLPNPLSSGLNSIDSIKCLKDNIVNGEWEIIHTHGFKERFYTTLYSRIMKRSKCKLITTLHGYTTTRYFSKKFIYQMLDKLLLGFQDEVISVSEQNSHGYTVIVNGISPNISCENMRKDIVSFASRGWSICSTGRLSKEKNYHTLIRAMKDLPSDIILVIMGEGPERNNLENLIEELELGDRVMLAGFVDSPACYYNLFKIYIQPSFTEGTPTSMLEAAACSKIMLLTPVGGMNDFIDNDAAVKIQIYKDSLYDGICVVKNFPSLYTVFAENAFNLFQKKYSAAKMVAAYDEIYRSLIKC